TPSIRAINLPILFFSPFKRFRNCKVKGRFPAAKRNWTFFSRTLYNKFCAEILLILKVFMNVDSSLSALVDFTSQIHLKHHQYLKKEGANYKLGGEKDLTVFKDCIADLVKQKNNLSPKQKNTFFTCLNRIEQYLIDKQGSWGSRIARLLGR